MIYSIWMHPEGHVYAYSVDTVTSEHGIRRRLFEQFWDDNSKLRHPTPATFIEQDFRLVKTVGKEHLDAWLDEGYVEVTRLDTSLAFRQASETDDRSVEERSLSVLVGAFDNAKDRGLAMFEPITYSEYLREPLRAMLTFFHEPDAFTPSVLLGPLPDVALFRAPSGRSRYDFWEARP